MTPLRILTLLLPVLPLSSGTRLPERVRRRRDEDHVFKGFQREHACKRLAWFMGLSSDAHPTDATPDYWDYAKAAVLSAEDNAPSLVPHLVFVGPPNDLTDWFQHQGFAVIFHNLSFFSDLPAHVALQAGAFLRLEVPEIMQDLQLDHDIERNFALYTDIDVLFLRDMDSCTLEQPRLFSMGAQHARRTIANTGVMYFNLSACRVRFKGLVQFGIEHKFDFPAFDQGLVLAYFKQEEIDRLPDNFNAKPYWGVLDPGITIVHFHGPKPRRGMPCMLENVNDIDGKCGHILESYRSIFKMAPDHAALYNLTMHAFQGYLLDAEVLAQEAE